MMQQHGNVAGAEHPQLMLRCRIDSSMLGLLREFVCTVARYLNFCESQVAEIEICVDEACANVIEHAYRGRATATTEPKDILVEIVYSGEQMLVRIVDQGDGSLATSSSQFSSVDDYADDSRQNYRGLGFLLMEKFMDRVDVRSVPGRGTTVELTKIRHK